MRAANKQGKEKVRCAYMYGGEVEIRTLGTLFTYTPSPTSKVSFQVNGFGGGKSVRDKEMCQLGIILVDQGV